MNESLSKLPFFSELPAEVIAAVDSRSRRLELDPGVTVIREGDLADSMFFLAKGAVRVVRSTTNEVLDTIRAPTLFGEMAIVAATRRLATVVTAEPSVVFQVSKDDVNGLAQYPSLRKTVLAFHRHRLMSNVLLANPMFAPIIADQRDRLSKSFTSQTVQSGHVFLREGQAGVGLFVILRGTCEVVTEASGEPQVVAQLGEGDIFGEISLVLFERVCTATVRAISDCVVLLLDREAFQRDVMSNAAVRQEMIKLALERLRTTEEHVASKTHLI